MTDSTLRSKNSSPRREPKAMQTELPAGPSATSIQLILGYSKALQVVDAPPIGQLDLILN